MIGCEDIWGRPLGSPSRKGGETRELKYDRRPLWCQSRRAPEIIHTSKDSRPRTVNVKVHQPPLLLLPAPLLCRLLQPHQAPTPSGTARHHPDSYDARKRQDGNALVGIRVSQVDAMDDSRLGLSAFLRPSCPSLLISACEDVRVLSPILSCIPLVKMMIDRSRGSENLKRPSGTRNLSVDVVSFAPWLARFRGWTWKT